MYLINTTTNTAIPKGSERNYPMKTTFKKSTNKPPASENKPWDVRYPGLFIALGLSLVFFSAAFVFFAFDGFSHWSESWTFCGCDTTTAFHIGRSPWLAFFCLICLRCCLPGLLSRFTLRFFHGMSDVSSPGLFKELPWYPKPLEWTSDKKKIHELFGMIVCCIIQSTVI